MVREVLQLSSERITYSRHNAGQMVHSYLERAAGGWIVLTHIILKTTLHIIEAIYVKIKTLKLFKGNRGDYFMTLE